MTRLSPNIMWEDRFDEVERNLARLEILLGDELIEQETAAGSAFEPRLNTLKADLEKLRAQAAKNDGAAKMLWERLTELNRECRKVIEKQLEFLGGVALGGGVGGREGFDGDFVALAREWLDEWRRQVWLDSPLTVIISRGPALEDELRVAQAPFLDWDLLHLPLLGRAIGLLATKPGSQFKSALDAVVDPLVGQIEKLLDGPPAPPPAGLTLMPPEALSVRQAYLYATTEEARATVRAQQKERLGHLAARQRRHLYHLFADMFSVALLGPAYALAAFVLEFDYREPSRKGLEDPEQIEGREDAPRFLPSSVERAAAILTTLQAMDNREARPAYQPEGPYTRIGGRLEAMWRETVSAIRRPDTLDAVRQAFKPLHESLYQDVIRKLLHSQMNETQAGWLRARDWYAALLHKRARPAPAPTVNELVSALWLYRLNYPGRMDKELAMAPRLLRGEATFFRTFAQSAAPTEVITQSRLERLRYRWERLESILQAGQIPEADRAAVAGRFYRLLSEQIQQLEACEAGLRQGKVRPGLWAQLAQTEDAARPLQREALEFLGGLLIHQKELDREPPVLARLKRSGPSVCDLADIMLRGYARRTGVNWSARTVLGKDPFLATDTDVIRVRFPDWSLWNLPLMAHEFGHLVALATPAFVEFQAEEGERAFDGCPPQQSVNLTQARQLRRRHLDELFADVFAAYALGPAYACDVLLLQLNPPEAHLPRGAHPTHAERAQVILQTLSRMDERTKQRGERSGAYTPLLTQLEECWGQAVELNQPAAADDAATESRRKQAERWGRNLFRIVDKSYRLGACYTPRRWLLAQKLAELLLKRNYQAPEVNELRQLARQHELSEVWLDDVLNALWWGRVMLAKGTADVGLLTAAANQLGWDFLGDAT